MGGYGSTRWSSHIKKTTVEEGLTLSMGVLADCRGFRERIPWQGQLRWSNSATGEEVATMGYQFFSQEEKEWDGRLRLIYTITRPKTSFSEEEKTTELDYWIDLETTPCNFGGERWWFRCPLIKNGRPCKRRCFKLYLPPRANHYGCRECYDLTYQSSQEAHQFDSLYESLADRSGLPFEVIKRHFA